VSAQIAGSPPARRRLWKLAPVVVVLAVLVAEAYWGAPSLEAAIAKLHAPHWGWLAGALLAELLSMSGYARMQRRLLRSAGHDVKFKRHVALAYAAHSLSVSLPGGPLFSTHYNFQQMRRYGASPAAASWSIALSGILSSIGLVLIGAGSALLAGSSFGWSTLWTYLIVAAVLAAAVRVVARHPEWLIKPTEAIVEKINKLRHKTSSAGGIASLVAQLAAVRIRPTDFAIALLFAILNWLFDALCLWMCCHAVGAISITPSQLVLAYCAGMAAASIPLVPGNLGVVDGALIVGLAAGGLATDSAIAAVVFYRILSLGFVIAAGWVVWLLVRRKQRAAPFSLLPADDRAATRIGRDSV
jgi:uncharacterized membrane protein YbhN (UPF0104 family)